MAKGFGSEDAAQDEIESAVNDAVRRAQSARPQGVSLTHCEASDAPITEGRQQARPAARLCVACEEAADQAPAHASGYNRRGRPYSQLR